MKLSDILSNSRDGGNIDELWNSTTAAEEYGPLPPGDYVAHITKGELITSRKNSTPGYRMEFTVIEGEFTNRKFWLDCWLTPAALAQSKRDLAKILITDPSMMERPIPRGIRCACKLALRKDEEGNESNRVKKFEVVGIDKPTEDAFAPKEEA